MLTMLVSCNKGDKKGDPPTPCVTIVRNRGTHHQDILWYGSNISPYLSLSECHCLSICGYPVPEIPEFVYEELAKVGIEKKSELTRICLEVENFKDEALIRLF